MIGWPEGKDPGMQTPLEWLQMVEIPWLKVMLGLLESLLVIVVLHLLRLALLRLIDARLGPDAIQKRYRWRKISAYAVGIVAALLIIPLWFSGIETLATFLGLTAAGLVVVLGAPIVDMVGWIFIVGARPFDVGDRIQIGEHRGDVIDVGLFQFSVLEIGAWVDADQSTGRVLHIPNKRVFQEPLANYTSDFRYIWNEVELTVTFESSWQKARDLLQEIADRQLGPLLQEAEEHARKAAQQSLILYNRLTPTVYVRVVPHGIKLTLRFLCEPRRRRSVEHALWEELLTVYAEHPDIEFAYPTQRVYLRERERGDLPESG
ncbi:MAG: mechanosensitive ion channel [Anaerolineae bacterium]